MDTTTHQTDTAAQAAPPPFETVFGNEMPTPTRFTELAREFAATIGRDVALTVPHGTLLSAEDYRDRRRALRRNHITISDDDFLEVTYFAAPRIPRWSEAEPMHGERHAFDGLGRVMMDAIVPYHSGRDEGDLILECITYGEEIGSPFIGLVDTTALFDYVGIPTPEHEYVTHKAFLFQDVLFVPYDQPHLNTPATAQAMRIVLEEAARMLSGRPGALSAEEREAMLQQRREDQARRRRELMRQQAQQFAEGLGSAAVNQLRTEARDMMETAATYRQSYLDSMRSAGVTMAHAEALQEQTRQTQANPDLMTIERMIDNGTLTSIEFDNMKAVVQTKPLLAYDPRTEAQHLIGRMRISIDMRGGSVIFRNLDDLTHGFEGDMQAPHVFHSGHACPGNFAEMQVDLMQRYDWVTLIQMAIAFIETANTNDAAGKYVHRWPFVHDPTEYGYPPYGGEVHPYDYDPGDEDEDEED